MQKLIRRLFLIGFTLLVSYQFLSTTALADVNVYAEGAYTATDLVVYIYADITSPTVLRSAGVKLTYANTELHVASAEKNGADWFIGSGSYMDPETSTPGEVVIILGKLDTANTSAGVSGNRVLLGKVVFTRTGSSTNFGLGLDYGRRGVEISPNNYSFKNFVDTANPANELDDTGQVLFGSITVRERGDANGDGKINAVDYIAIRNNLNATNFPPWMDCNGDGKINAVDYVCVRNKL